MPPRAWVGLDVGTTASKATVYRADGTPVAGARTATAWQTSEHGTQIDPNALRDGAVDALNRAVAQAIASAGTWAGAAEGALAAVAIAGVGVTSMGETGILVDGHDRPVAPAIAWHDGRDEVEVAELGRDLGASEFATRAGKPLRGQFSLTKYRWQARHDPGVTDAVRRFNVAEWVARGLGADAACELSLAGRTGWFDIAGGDWWDEALAWSGADRRLMPDVVAAGAPIGRVTAAAAHPGLAGAVVTLAGHDHQAAALGAGAVHEGDELDSSGTAEALVRTVRPDLDPAARRTLADGGITTDPSIQAGRWSLLGGTEGGLAMRRVLDLLGVTTDDLAALDERALAASSGRVTVTGVGGRALGLSGIADGVDPGAAWRAVVEAATAQALELHRVMTAVAGPHNRLIATGGWCRSAMVRQAKRAAFGDVLFPAVSEAGTLGAATLAARATGDLGPHDRLGSDS